MLGAPVSLITVLDRDRQWFKATSGLDLAENRDRRGVARGPVVAAPRVFVEVAATLLAALPKQIAREQSDVAEIRFARLNAQRVVDSLLPVAAFAGAKQHAVGGLIEKRDHRLPDAVRQVEQVTRRGIARRALQVLPQVGAHGAEPRERLRVGHLRPADDGGAVQRALHGIGNFCGFVPGPIAGG